jgi:hypothetical protein
MAGATLCQKLKIPFTGGGKSEVQKTAQMQVEAFNSISKSRNG